MSTWDNTPGSAGPDGGSGYGSEDKWALPPEYAAGADSGSGAAPYERDGADGGRSPARSGVPVPVVAVGAVAILALAGIALWALFGSGGGGEEPSAAPAVTTSLTQTATATETVTETETETATPTSASVSDYPAITSDGVSYDTGDSRIVCMGDASRGYFTCQNMTSDWDGHNTLSIDLRSRSVTHTDGDYDSDNTSLEHLPESTKYSYNGLVVQGKGDTLYFSSPDHAVRGEITADDCRIFATD